MSEYINDLFEAFKNVDTEFYSTEAISHPEAFFDDHIPRNTFVQQTELHFSTELYAEWRQIIKYKNGYNNLKIGFEVNKKYIAGNLIEDKKSFKPDLILHQSQITFDPYYQKIYIEAKTNSSLSVKKILFDIKKIVYAMNQYHFESGVFISVNCKRNRLLILIAKVKDKIERLIEEENATFWDNIYLFYGNRDGVKQIIKFNDPLICVHQKVDQIS